MNAKKKRDKDRRRARKLAEQAWDAAEAENYGLAVKLIRRAIDLAPGNPQLRNDEGLLLEQAGEDRQAADAFQAAVSLAPDFAEAYARLAGIRVRQGRASEAVAVQIEAVRHAPQSEQYRQFLAAYRALTGEAANETTETDAEDEVSTDAKTCPLERARRDEFPDLAVRGDALDWTTLADEMKQQGCALIAGLLPSDRCAELRRMADDSSLFAKSVVMNKSRFGQGVYRYFRAPLPALVDAIRRIVYPHVAAIANRWQELLGERDQYPFTWEAFRRRCAEAGQTTPTPLLLSYETEGFNAPHRDIRGEVYFPIQLVIVLSPRLESETLESDAEANGFAGGEFLFCDVPERKKSDRRRIPAGLGDAVLFCTSARLAQVAGVHGLRGVKHGMDRITHGTRHALGIPFHEYE